MLHEGDVYQSCLSVNVYIVLICHDLIIEESLRVILSSYPSDFRNQHF